MARESEGYKAVEFPSFGGLELRQDAQEAATIDAKNVMFDRPGRVYARYGLSTLLTASAAPTAIFKQSSYLWFYFTGSNVYAVAQGTQLGGSACTDTPTQLLPSPVSGGAAYYIVGTYSTSSSTVKKVTHAASPVVSSPAGIPSASCLGVQTPDDRLVVGNAGGTIGKLAFSDPGDPETFDADNYVTLPYRQDGICAIRNWNNLLFVFTDIALFVFYGNSTDSGGGSVFNYRLVSGDIQGLATATYGSFSTASTMDGLYFNTRTGLWKTTGGPPELVSQAIGPLYTSTVSPYFSGGNLGVALRRVHADDTYVYVQTGGDNYIMVYNTREKWWTAWDVNTVSFVMMIPGMTSASGSIGSRPIFAWTGSTAIGQMDPAATSDVGNAISSLYRSGFSNPGEAGAESYVREWLIDGTGTVTFKTATDDATTLSSGNSVTLGTSPAIARGRDRTAVKGSNFSWQVGASSGAWSVSRVIANLRGQREAGPDGT